MLAALGISSFFSFVVSLTLGARLLRLALRTMRLPEFAVGMAFMSAGVIGWVLMLIANARGNDLEDTLALVGFVGGYACIGLGIGFTYLFIWRVFRPHERWAAVLFWCAAAVLVLTLLPSQLPLLQSINEESPVAFLVMHWTGHTARVGAGAWGAIEAFRYFFQMRKRRRLGLARASVTNRFLLWGIASTTTALICLSTALLPTGATAEAPGPLFMISIAIFATANGAAQWLAFLPPKAYLRWIEGPALGAET